MKRLLLLPLLLCAGLALGQPAADVERLEQAVMQARQDADIAHPDQPEWRQVIRLAESLSEAAPESVELALLRARIYSEVDWYARAWTAWLDYSELSGAEPDAAAFAEAGLQLGFARYRAGDAAGAAGHYAILLEHQPDNAEALFWLGRIQLEAGEDSQAADTFGRLLELGDDAALQEGQLRLARHVQAYGPAAALAFADGIDLSERGDPARALARFEAAFEADRSFTEAAVWAGRTALELEDPALAAVYWRWAAELDPDDARNAWFLQLAERQDRWGIQATASFDAGQVSYGAGELEKALEQFEEAVRHSPEYVDALSWSARVAQELGRVQLAADYWQRVVTLAPTDEGARYFLRQAEQRLAFGTDVSDAFLEGVALYQAADFGAAEAAFLEVTTDDPEFAPAWGYLGQIYFARRDYADAALAYESARVLEPANDEYTFFAMEARRLAGQQD